MTTPPPAERAPPLAGLGARLAAKLIDSTVTAIIAFVAFVAFVLLSMSATGFSFVSHSESEPLNNDEAYGLAWPYASVLLYEAAMIATTAWRGKTPGKKLLGIQVIAHSGSGTPSALRAIIRWALPLAAAAPLVAAFILDIPELANNERAAALSGRVWWIWVAVGWWLLVHASTLWDSQRRGWHDTAAGTIVIRAPRQPRRPGPRPVDGVQRRRDMPSE